MLMVVADRPRSLSRRDVVVVLRVLGLVYLPVGRQPYDYVQVLPTTQGPCYDPYVNVDYLIITYVVLFKLQ